jgi:hypothetical protein
VASEFKLPIGAVPVRDFLAMVNLVIIHPEETILNRIPVCFYQNGVSWVPKEMFSVGSM